MSLTIKSCYAIRGLYEMYKLQNRNKEEKNSKISISKIAESSGISQEFLAKIFAELKKTKIVASEKGKFGGFYFTKAPEEINLSEIVEVLEVPLSSYDCISEGECENQNNCPVEFVWRRVQDAIFNELSNITLKDVIEYGKKKEALAAKSQ
ncbi:Rrf2 family transcriptional regulator [Petrotoga mexicana DSM 14811]|uniref:Rrf2 family transcriptional regulator n=1 Tax=Petrotoga mexicana DSM 14811 TaxID=1122954 RepID=A0A2K1PAI8_9BACT|nr:Rrf2 family transcriptional regulator [Petrotoga mexicana]PNR99747.1 Rrf2 family transcriptional regulator [Petrotoga mexicana DSM 14811]